MEYIFKVSTYEAELSVEPIQDLVWAQDEKIDLILISPS